MKLTRKIKGKEIWYDIGLNKVVVKEYYEDVLEEPLWKRVIRKRNLWYVISGMMVILSSAIFVPGKLNAFLCGFDMPIFGYWIYDIIQKEKNKNS